MLICHRELAGITEAAMREATTVIRNLLLPFVIVAVEESDCYVEAAAVTVVAVLVLVYVLVLPGLNGSRFGEPWAAGQETDRAAAL